jgi:PTS system cellobiose-specific IIB component
MEMAEQKKINVLMVCAMGMSSSLIEAKTGEAAKKAGIPFELKAIDTAELGRWDWESNRMDVVLVAPQVRFKKKSIEEAAGPLGSLVLNIDTIAYGMVDGEAIFNQIIEALKEAGRL